MKIAICSDVHLEFGQLELKNTEGAEVLILGGDILVAEDLNRHPGDSGPYAAMNSHRYINAQRYRDFLDMVNYEFPNVIYLAGNHEFYGGKWNKTLEVLRSYMENYKNIHFLERDCLTVNDVTFIGHILRPTNTVSRHVQTRGYIRSVIEGNHDKKYVVCTHHAPSFASIPPEYRGQHLMNGAYASKLEEFILDHPQIKLWTHGHTHDPWDYMIGDTRVFCNPRGYKGYEVSANDFVLKYVDVV